MFRFATAFVAVSVLSVLAGCSAPVGDDAAQSAGDQALKSSKSDDAFLMSVLANAGVPEVAPEKGVLGVGPSRTAVIDLTDVTGGLAGQTTKSGQVSSEDGTAYGDIADTDLARLDKVLVKGGASWVKGEVRCCDVPTTDTLSATVSCHTVVAPGSPVSCTITPAGHAPSMLDDKFMYDLLTGAGVAPDATKPLPGASAKYTAHVRLSEGGIGGVKTADVSWASQDVQLESSSFDRVETILNANGSVWGVMGPVTSDPISTLESYVTCWETVTVDPIAHCTYEAANIRPL